MKDRPQGLQRVVCAAVVALGSLPLAVAVPRDYVPTARSRSFFVPRQVKIDAVGIVNEDMAYVATRSGIKALHREGPPTPVIEVDNEEIKAFHLCHHRSSILYEVLSRDGGALSIYEYSIPVRTKVKVKEFQDAAPATSLACADQWLLRASPSALRAVHLPSGVQSELRRFQEQAADSFSALSVAYAADVIGRAEVFATSPGNRTLSRLRLRDDGNGLVREEASEQLLGGGDGADGPLSAATVQAPAQLSWSRGQVLFTDGCILRALELGASPRVRTLLGSSTTCVRPGNETVEPAPWASRLSRPLALAAGAEGTASTPALLLTEAQVLHVEDEPDLCSAAAGPTETSGAACVAASAEHGGGCGWAEGLAAEEHLCLECKAFERWAAAQKPAVDLCSLETAAKSGTRYSLSGCGCMAKPTAEPAEEEAERIQVNLSILLVVLSLLGCVLLYRRGRRETRLQEVYGVDTAEFHVFRDEENGAR